MLPAEQRSSPIRTSGEGTSVTLPCTVRWPTCKPVCSPRRSDGSSSSGDAPHERWYVAAGTVRSRLLEGRRAREGCHADVERWVHMPLLPPDLQPANRVREPSTDRTPGPCPRADSDAEPRFSLDDVAPQRRRRRHRWPVAQRHIADEHLPNHSHALTLTHQSRGDAGATCQIILSFAAIPPVPRRSASGTGSVVERLRTIERIDAEPTVVSDAWTDPARMRRWLFASDRGEIVLVDVDLRWGVGASPARADGHTQARSLPHGVPDT